MDTNTIRLFSSAKSDDWSTPSWLYDQLDAEFHFTLDPCPLNSMKNGLLMEWSGSVFVNPPYSNITQFLQKAREELDAHHCHTVVFLLFSKTDTHWFHEYIYHKADEIRFIKGRLRFGTAKSNAMHPSMIVVFRTLA
jgi:phage N-6-adenine-methyltransferase